MHVFAWEALTAGVWLDAPASLLREGLAMRDALVEDLRRIDGCRVSTIVQNSPGISEHPWEVAFDRVAATADICWLIAPETHGLLAERCRRVEALGGTLVGPSSAAVELCGDKLQLARHLESHNIPTIPTQPFDGSAEFIPHEPPVVVKPRLGAGSDSIRIVHANSAEFISHDSHVGWAVPTRPQDVAVGIAHPTQELICQPFHPGQPVSVAAIVGPQGTATEIFPLCRQHLSDDGRFTYLGGEFPVRTDRKHEIERLVRRACESIDGLRSYIGFDLILPDDANAPAVIVEINPRLTTSYVGYRRLTADNIAGRALGEPGASATGGNAGFAPIRWKMNSLRFHPDGRCIGDAGEV